MSRGGSTHFEKFCKVCRDAGKSKAEFTSHFVRASRDPNSAVTCPVLLSIVCHKCGENGHTPRYCRVGKVQRPSVTKKRRVVVLEDKPLDKPLMKVVKLAAKPKKENIWKTVSHKKSKTTLKVEKVGTGEFPPLCSKSTIQIGPLKRSFAAAAATTPKRSKTVKQVPHAPKKSSKVVRKVTILPKRVTFDHHEEKVVSKPKSVSKSVSVPNITIGVNEDGEELWGDMMLDEDEWSAYISSTEPTVQDEEELPALETRSVFGLETIAEE